MFVDLQREIIKHVSMEKLTKQEEEVMRCIWELGHCCVKEILSRMDEPKPPYTTLASIVKNLERKTYVKAQQKGNTYYYIPRVEESDYKRNFMSHFVHNYFANSYKEMVTFFAREQKISAEELKEILRSMEEDDNLQ